MRHSLSSFITAIFVLIVSTGNSQTLSLKDRAEKLILNLKKNNNYPIGANDTLIDINKDGYKDILVEFYAGSGTGLKNAVSVYLYNNSKKNFENCEQLTYLANPSFYIDTKMVTGYYLGNGSGSATKLKWNGAKLDTLVQIDIDVIDAGTDIRFKLRTIDYRTKKITTKTLDVMALPQEYNYMDYKSIIQNSSR